jgi:predicted metal-dependent hydrolase
MAILDIAQQRATPIGIRQGRRILYRHSQLQALATAHQALLATQDHWPPIQAPEQEAAAQLPS